MSSNANVEPNFTAVPSFNISSNSTILDANFIQTIQYSLFQQLDQKLKDNNEKYEELLEKQLQIITELQTNNTILHQNISDLAASVQSLQKLTHYLNTTVDSLNTTVASYNTTIQELELRNAIMSENVSTVMYHSLFILFMLLKSSFF